MNIEEYMKKFNEYVKRYDLKSSKEMMEKFHHTYRVINYSKEIAKSLNLDEKDIFTAELIGLLHDIGRFEQWTNYQTFYDYKSVDHSMLALKIIEDNDIYIDKDIKNIVLKAISNHNKYKIEDGLTEKELLFSKIIRDADKLDILLEQANSINEDNLNIKDEVIEMCKSKKQILNELLSNQAEKVLKTICLIFDLNFKYSYQFVLKNKIIENKLNILENHVVDFDKEKIEEIFMKYVKERLEC